MSILSSVFPLTRNTHRTSLLPMTPSELEQLLDRMASAYAAAQLAPMGSEDYVQWFGEYARLRAKLRVHYRGMWLEHEKGRAA